MALATFVPIVFDPHSGDVFNLPKYTLVVIGALVLSGLWVVSAVHTRSVAGWRNGLQWLVGAIVAWTTLTAFTGVDTHVALLGDYGSYDGLFSAMAFGALVMVAAQTLDVTDVRRVLGAGGLAAGAVVLLYGLLQLHDTEVAGSKWDFINWHSASFVANIFSTFGNPNHLGGYLAMALPIFLVFGLGAKRWRWRVVAAGSTLLLLVELVRTAARGAWLAAIVASAVLALSCAPELRRKALATLGGAAAVLAAAVVAMAVAGRHFLGQPLSTLFQSGGSTSVEQRLLIWKTAFHIAAQNPLTGVGPDSFAVVYPQYQSAAWVKALGPDYLVNGAHNIFMNVLADQGFPGLLLFVALLGLAALRAVGAWRRFRQVEKDQGSVPGSREQARYARVTLAVVTASISAYIVQALFNVQQVGLSFTFWLLVGLLAVLATAAGVPDTLRPRALVTLPPQTATEAAPGDPSARAYRARPGPARRPLGASPPAMVADRAGGRCGYDHRRPGISRRRRALPGRPRLLGGQGFGSAAFRHRDHGPGRTQLPGRHEPRRRAQTRGNRPIPPSWAASGSSRHPRTRRTHRHTGPRPGVTSPNQWRTSRLRPRTRHTRLSRTRPSRASSRRRRAQT